jgi:hypothetical protein
MIPDDEKKNFFRKISRSVGYQLIDTSSKNFTVVEYLIVIKLICWPLLFALFARTAKNVDQEADRIWKYQLYGLGSDFRQV